jgi:3-dehydroquinate synthetase
MPDVRPEKLIEAMKHDKKNLQGKIKFVLPRTTGEVVINEDVNISILEQVLVDQDE